MTVTGRGAKLEIWDEVNGNWVDLTKLMAVYSVGFSLEVNNFATMEIKAYVDNYEMDENGVMRVGKCKEETFEKADKDRSLIF